MTGAGAGQVVTAETIAQRDASSVIARSEATKQSILSRCGVLAMTGVCGNACDLEQRP
jgi:hypothetical protein